MRHRVFGKKLNRDIKERKSLFRNLIISFITYGKIQTTMAKAKATQRLIEKLVTHAKDGTDAALRQISSVLNTKKSVDKLTKEIVPKFAGRIGGYVRIRRIGRRSGDGAEKVIMEWNIPTDKIQKEQENKKTTENKKNKNI